MEGHDRWRRALRLGLDTLLCLEHDVTDEVALAMTIRGHQSALSLNDFCRIELALQLEPAYRTARLATMNQARGDSSTLTPRVPDVRGDLAALAGVSTGNVTKVRQILASASPELLRALRQGTVSIHRAWQWRDLSHFRQREALRNRQQRMSLDRVVRDLITRQAQAERQLENGVQGRERQVLLERLGAGDAIPFVLEVVEIPGLALVVTRELRDRLVSRQSAP